MLDRAIDHIGDGFNPAMRMPGESLLIHPRIIVAEVIHHQERIQLLGVLKPEHTVQMYTPAPSIAGTWPGAFPRQV